MTISSINKEKFEDYEGFVEKFKPKKTTDDCYTPPEVYEVIKNWVVKEYNLENKKIVRPFYPGGDYENFEYDDNTVVIDNPPFSLLSKIRTFYNNRNIKYFLFAPHLTLFGAIVESNFIVTDAKIIYENGAIVKTSFVHNFEDSKIRTSAQLSKLIKEAQNKNKVVKLKYDYPDELITSTKLEKYISRGIDIRFEKDELHYIRRLDEMKKYKKEIFGSGFLTNKKLPYVDNLPTIKTTQETETYTFELSERERKIVNDLSK